MRNSFVLQFGFLEHVEVTSDLLDRLNRRCWEDLSYAYCGRFERAVEFRSRIDSGGTGFDSGPISVPYLIVFSGLFVDRPDSQQHLKCWISKTLPVLFRFLKCEGLTVTGEVIARLPTVQWFFPTDRRPVNDNPSSVSSSHSD